MLKMQIVRFDAKDIVTASVPVSAYPPGFSSCGCLISQCQVAVSHPGNYGLLHENCPSASHDCGYKLPLR